MLITSVNATPCAAEFHMMSFSLSELLSPVQSIFSDHSPLLIRVLLTVLAIRVLLQIISIRLGFLSNQHHESLWLVYAQTIALTASYSVSWFTTVLLWLFGCVNASIHFDDTAIFLLVIACSLSYPFDNVFPSLRQLVRRIPDFNRLQVQGARSLAPTFRMLLHFAANHNSSSCFPFEQRLRLAMFALERNYQQMLEPVLCCTNPSISCSYRLQMLAHRVSDFDHVAVSVKHLVPAALSALIELAVADSTHGYVQLVDRVYLNLYRGDAECLETFLDSVHTQDADLLSLYLRFEARCSTRRGGRRGAGQ